MKSNLVVGSLNHAAASVSLSSRMSHWLQSLKIDQIFRGGEAMVSNKSSTFWKVLTKSTMGVLGLMVGWSLSGSISSCLCLMAEWPLAWSAPCVVSFDMGGLLWCSFATMSWKDWGWWFWAWGTGMLGCCLFVVVSW